MCTPQYMQWSNTEVTSWLGSIHLHHLIPNFERMQIDGAKLAALSDQDLRVKLRITKPAEVMMIKGALGKLQDDMHQLNEQKRRVSSTKLLSTGAARDRTGSFGREEHITHARTMPREAPPHRNTIAINTTTVKAPRLMHGSASELIEQSKYSGWIRKQGGSYKSWKKRYLILRQGCLYYFKDEVASSPKGSFVLSGYDSDICKEPEIVKKCRYTLKLTPMNPQVRTYYISVGSKRELEGWKQAIDEEIGSVTTRTMDGRHNTVFSTPVGAMSQGGSMMPAMFDDDDDDDDNEDPYEPIPPDENDEGSDHNYDDPQSLIYDRPAADQSDEEEEESAYSKIDPLAIMAMDSKPTVPSRSEISLVSSSAFSPKAPAPLPPIMPTVEDSVEVEDTYLPIVAGGPATNPAAAQPDFSRPSPSPVHSDSMPGSSGFLSGHDANDYDNDDNLEDSGPEDDEDGCYYIMFRRPEELMPSSCVFDRLERPEADRMLKEMGMDGMYLIRGGSHAGAEKVLSVWHTDKCRHYRLFKDENQSYSLTQGQSFRTIPELLQYYTLQQKLPRSDYYLGNPYNPLDH